MNEAKVNRTEKRKRKSFEHLRFQHSSPLLIEQIDRKSLTIQVASRTLSTILT